MKRWWRIEKWHCTRDAATAVKKKKTEEKRQKLPLFFFCLSIFGVQTKLKSD